MRRRGQRLNLGCGYEPSPGWVRVDANENAPDLDWCGDVRGPLPYEDGFFAEIKAVDVLEHLPWRDSIRSLTEWGRVLSPNGKLYVQVPDARTCVEWWLEGAGAPTPGFPAARPWKPDHLRDELPIVSLAWRLMGGQEDGQFTRDGDDWRLNAHYALFDADYLTHCVEAAGLKVHSMRTNPHPNLLCWIRKGR